MMPSTSKAALGCSAVALAVYLNTFSAGFVYDDT